jgi:hypothetical protein
LKEIRKTRQWRDFLLDVSELQAVDLQPLVASEDQRLAFFLNVYNLIICHAIVALGPAHDTLDRVAFYKVWMDE